MMARGLVVCLLLSLPALCCAYNLNCTVLQNGDFTYYNITDTSNVSLTGHDSFYDWTNETGHVLANSMDEMKDLVVTNSINLLITSKCINTMYFAGMCTTEDEQCTALCHTICHESAHDKGHRKASLIIQTVLISIGVLLLVVGLVFVGYKCKAKLFRCCGCGQTKCQYTAANMQTPTNGLTEVTVV